MSAFSDWKCGALTDEQFYSLTARENRRDRDLYEESLRDYNDVCHEGEDYVDFATNCPVIKGGRCSASCYYNDWLNQEYKKGEEE